MKKIHLQNASAGSGKTYTLANEVMNKVLGGTEPEKLIVTTFTKKAAAELRERLRQRLIEGKMTDAARRVKDGHIGTVNSVSARILMEYAIDAGASPALDVLPEEDQQRIFEEAIVDAVASCSAVLEPAADRCGLNEDHAYFGEPRNWKNDVRNIVALARSNRMGAEQLRAFGGSSWKSIRTFFATAQNGRDDSAALLSAIGAAIRDMEGATLETATAKGELKDLKQYQRDIKRQGYLPWSKWAKLAEGGKAVESRAPKVAAQAAARRLLEQKQLYEDVEALTQGVFDCAADAIDQYDSYKKAHGLMDFADQDAGVLDLLEDNPAIAKMFAERIDEVFVDEFQDTNPIQLELFVELGRLAKKSLWVGDPKQAIFGFRGTDAELMAAATKAIPPENIEKPLCDSYRSKEELLKFTNALFKRVFHEMKEKDVCLDVPEKLREESKGGWIETWQIGGNADPYKRGIAGGITDLRARRPELNPGMIAVLCRSNRSCELVAKNLEEMGVRATAEQGDIMATPECRLAIAALKYMVDSSDTLALTEIVSLSPFHAAHEGWLADILRRSKEEDNVRERFKVWSEDALTAGLASAAGTIRILDVAEALETAIDRVRLAETIAIWTKPEQRFGNLDKLRSACGEYLEFCRARRSAATVIGFVLHLADTATKQAQGVGEDAVQVLTYHKAKGLEWPVVVLADLGNEPRFTAFGISVETDAAFDAAHPLEGRFIRYWPWPFGGKKTVPGLDELIAATSEHEQALVKEQQELQRLMYVGMTRAREGIVLAAKASGRNRTDWLDQLTDKNGVSVLRLPQQPGNQELLIGDDKISVQTIAYEPEDFSNDPSWRKSVTYVAPLAEKKEYPTARIVASAESDQQASETAEVKKVLATDARLPVDISQIAADRRRASEYVGNATHAYFAINPARLSVDQRLAMAKGCVERWGLEGAIKPDALVAVGEELNKYIDDTHSPIAISCELPVSYRNELGQLMEGFVDMLVETEDGYVIVDHKTFSGTNPESKVKEYAPQLFAYKEAVENATGKPVLATLVHMPGIGAIYEIVLS